MKLRFRLLSVLLCLVVFLSFSIFSVSATTLYPVGDWVYELINNNTEFEVYQYRGNDEIVATPYIHNGRYITSIGQSAFDGNKTLKTMYVFDEVSKISNFAFNNCTSLETVVLSSSVDTVLSTAFSGCTSLKNINLENTSLTRISTYCFTNCDSLTEITLPITLTEISKEAFGHCDNLSKVVIPESVISIDNDAFYNSPNVVIYCYENSTAHTYAVENGIEYVLMTPPRTYMLGDIDDDGEITVMDATRIQLILVELYKNYTEEDVIRGDVEKDGVLSIMDVTSIQRYSASFDDGLGIGETFEF